MGGDPLPAILSLFFVFVLVLLNGFFVAAEYAMVKVKHARIEFMVQEGNIRAKIAKNITQNTDAYLSACQLGITLASLGLGWIGGPAAAKLLEPLLKPFAMSEAVTGSLAFLIAFAFIAILHIVLGEMAPKALALRKTESVTLLLAVPLMMFRRILGPCIWLINGMSNLLLQGIGIEPLSDRDAAHSEEEIRILLKESNRTGHIDNTEMTLVDNVFEFAETHAREIMIPRTEMVCLNANDSFADNRDLAIKEMHTRYPVCDPDKDNIIGFVHIKDLLTTGSHHPNIRFLIRPITSVPDSMQISQLLKLLQKNKTQMALLIDEYGGTSGIVTFKDIVEEIVGEIQDEFDDNKRPSLEQHDEFTHSIDGMMLIEEVNSLFGTDISNGNYDTIGGWLYAQFENPPARGQYMNYQDEFIFFIEETEHLRISRITLKKVDILNRSTG